jgi:hypothetical protein
MYSAIVNFFGKIKHKGKMYGYICYSTETCESCRMSKCKQIYSGGMIKGALTKEDVLDILQNNAKILVFCITGEELWSNDKTDKCFTNLKSGVLILEKEDGMTEYNDITKDEFSQKVYEAFQYLKKKYDKERYDKRGVIGARKFKI